MERRLGRHGPGEAIVRLRLTDDVYLRGYNYAGWQLGIPLPADG